ncbi:MAG: hypothetical protein ACOX4Z_07540 [Desulfobulbus sp.]
MIKKSNRLGLLYLFCLLGVLGLFLASSAVATTTRPQAKQNKSVSPLAMVAYLHSEEALQTMQAELPLVDFHEFSATGEMEKAEILVVLPLVDLSNLADKVDAAFFELYEVHYTHNGSQASGKGGLIKRDAAFLQVPLKGNRAYVVRMLIPEGIPNLAICLRLAGEPFCWLVSYDGMTGSVIFDDRFIPWNQEQYLQGKAYSPPRAAEQVVGNGTASYYRNERYGFSLSWPPGVYTVVAAENGDGILVQDEYGLTMRAYGTRSYAVMNQGFEDALVELAQTFDSVSYKKSNPQAGWFVLSGYRGENIGYVKCFFVEDRACIVDFSYPKLAKTNYDELVGTVVKTFQVHASELLH